METSLLGTVAEGCVSQEDEGMRDLKDLRGITVLRVSCFGRMTLKTLSSCLICPSSLNMLSHSLSKEWHRYILVWVLLNVQGLYARSCKLVVSVWLLPLNKWEINLMQLVVFNYTIFIFHMICFLFLFFVKINVYFYSLRTINLSFLSTKSAY